MSQNCEAALAAYARFDFAAAGYERRVYRRGRGPAAARRFEVQGRPLPALKRNRIRDRQNML